ncbi:MAG: hypothetical protein FWH36_02170 [Lentimicrobiaceae bacterium]|nr:hypothetical protein [Lentimicrobiaceae bacterium]
MKNFCLVLFSIVLLSSCSRDSEMDRTIFIPDEDNAALPAYTEWGYNSFGAEYERDYFLVSHAIVPCKIVYNRDKQLEFSLQGRLRNSQAMTLTFIFSSVPSMQNYTDLVQLNDLKIDLSGDDCTVKILQDGSETVIEELSGEFHFKRTQLLSIDEKVNRVILSGTFDLQFLQNELPASISDGRFDLGITGKDFFAYK